MRLLEETGVVENRGSGIPMMITAMREARLEPPQFRDTRASFRVIFKNHTLLDPETVAWLNQFAAYPLTDAQRMALAYLRVNPRMTNSDYRRLNNTTTVEATRDLRELVDLGLIEMHGTRRWAYYTLSVQPQPREVPLMSNEERILAYLQEHETITNSECRELLGLGDDERRARYVLSKMVKQGLIRKVGEKRWARYELV
jgi:predicted HTH transcriptional regulator